MALIWYRDIWKKREIKEKKRDTREKNSNWKKCKDDKLSRGAENKGELSNKEFYLDASTQQPK